MSLFSEFLGSEVFTVGSDLGAGELQTLAVRRLNSSILLWTSSMEKPGSS